MSIDSRAASLRTAALALAFIAGVAADLHGQQTNAREALERVLPETARLREGEKEALVGLFQTQATTFPVGSSAGGFTWGFDPALGIPVRRSRSFGPMFAERPFTNGRHRFSVSAGYQRTEWRAMAGHRLADGFSFDLNTEDGWLRYGTAFELTTEQVVGTAMYGVTERVDIGVRVPYLRQRVMGFLFFPCNTCDGGFDLYVADGMSTGPGDISIRAKVALPRHGVDLAAAVDLRLPTGDERQLLGSGSTQLTAMLVGGREFGRMAPHFNAGYTFAGPGLVNVGSVSSPDYLQLGGKYQEEEFHPSDELKYTLGMEFVAARRVTLAGDIAGRALFNAAQPVILSTPGFAKGLSIQRDTVNLLLAAVSAKILVGGNWLLTSAIAFPLNDNGIQPGLTPVFGLEHAF